jgi:hypothetical protein
LITKLQFQSLIKEKLLWPGWDWVIKDTVDGIQNTVNEEVTGLVEILIDVLYDNYINVEKWPDIFNLDTSDNDKEAVIIPCKNNNLSEGDLIRVSGTLNYNKQYTVISADQNSFTIHDSFKPESFRFRYNCPVCGYYVITEGPSPDPIFCAICSSRYPDRLNLTEYDPPRFYKISFNRYEEDEPIYLDVYSSVVKSDVEASPKYLPDLGYEIGYAYNGGMSIADNRKFIKSAIEVYRIKGTALSIKRIMRLLGYECRINEPFKHIFTLNKSKLGGVDRLTDWNYYHHGIVEIETNDVSMSAYKTAISSTVQPVGTRLVGRNNIAIPLIPMIPPTELIEHVFRSIYIESVIRYLKSGDIYDIGSSSRRSRSGNRGISGFYIGKGIELFAQAFRRVFDSNIFSLADLSTSYETVKPAGRYSSIRGPYSGSSKKINWNTTQYNELSPLDLQLPFALKDYQARLPGRSDHAVRSGKYAMSGTLGTGWNKNRYWIQNYGPIVELLNENANFVSRGLERSLYTSMKVQTAPGTILSVNRVLSSLRRIHGFELVTEFLYRGVTDWDTKRYYMYDDEARRINFYDTSQEFVNEGFDRERYLSPVHSKRPTQFVHNEYRRSGRRVAYGTSRELSIEFRNSISEPVMVCADEAKSFFTKVTTYKTLQASLIDESYRSDKNEIELYLSPLFVDKRNRISSISNIMSEKIGPVSGRLGSPYSLTISGDRRVSTLTQNIVSPSFDITIEYR